MKGVDPNSSNVNGPHQQENQTNQADNSREVTIGNKKAIVSKAKKGLRRFISILLNPGKWLRSSRSKTKNTSPVRHTPLPQDQPGKATGTPIQERSTTTPAANRPLPSIKQSPLPAPPAAKRELPPIPSDQGKPQIQKTSLGADAQPTSMEDLGALFEQDAYLDHTGKLDKNAIKQHLRQFSKEALRPLSRNSGYNSLPEGLKPLAQAVYAEKKVAGDIKGLPVGSAKGKLDALRTKLSKAYGAASPVSLMLVKEFDRQQFTARCSQTYQAISQTPRYLQKEFPVFRKVLDDELSAVKEYKGIRAQSPKLTNTFTRGNEEGDHFFTEATPKYGDIKCDIDSCAGSKDHPVHANYVRLSDAPDEVQNIAAQGPTEKNIHHFAHMINDTDSRISVCLVSKKELDPPEPVEKKRTVSLGPRSVGDTIGYDGVNVKLADQYFLDHDADGNHNVRIDKLEINGKTHFRVYDTGWEDHSSGNPSRLAALAVLVEQLKQEPGLEKADHSPMVVNCNAGVGRTGTFLTISDSTRNYLKNGTVSSDLRSGILKARETRPAFVQTPGQYYALLALHDDLPSALNPLLSAAGLEAPAAAVHRDIVDEADIYVNLPGSTAALESSETVSPAVPGRQASEGVATARQFMNRYSSDYYHRQEDYWEAVEQDINTITDPKQLSAIKEKISDRGSRNPAEEEAARYIRSLADTQLARLS